MACTWESRDRVKDNTWVTCLSYKVFTTKTEKRECRRAWREKNESSVLAKLTLSCRLDIHKEVTRKWAAFPGEPSPETAGESNC